MSRSGRNRRRPFARTPRKPSPLARRPRNTTCCAPSSSSSGNGNGNVGEKKNPTAFYYDLRNRQTPSVIVDVCPRNASRSNFFFQSFIYLFVFPFPLPYPTRHFSGRNGIPLARPPCARQRRMFGIPLFFSAHIPAYRLFRQNDKPLGCRGRFVFWLIKRQTGAARFRLRDAGVTRRQNMTFAPSPPPYTSLPILVRPLILYVLSMETKTRIPIISFTRY